MSKPLFCILGASGAGKTSLVEKLERDLNMHQIPSYTTRSWRNNKSDNDHIFITEKEFKQLDNVIAYNYYMGNHYGVTLDQINDENNILYVVDQNGLKKLKQNYKGSRKIYSIFIDCSEFDRYTRLFKRYLRIFLTDNANKAFNQTEQRIKADKIEFKDCKKNVDCIIRNNNKDFQKAYHEIKEYILSHGGCNE